MEILNQILFWYLVGSLLGLGCFHTIETFFADEDEKEDFSLRIYITIFFTSWISIIAMGWGFIKAMFNNEE